MGRGERAWTMKRALHLLCALAVVPPLAYLLWTSASYYKPTLLHEAVLPPLTSYYNPPPLQEAVLPPLTVCDVFEGEWVLDDEAPLYPLYKPGACPFVEESFACSAHGRPDSNFTRWSWRPHACPLPSFNGKDMVESLRGKRVVFVGDSLSRNQWESMLCLLSQALPNHSSVIEVNGLEISKDKGFLHFLFQDYNCHLEYYSSHFLVEEDYNISTGRMCLRLDRLHMSHSRWSKADVLIFTTGHWWTHGKTARG